VGDGWDGWRNRGIDGGMDGGMEGWMEDGGWMDGRWMDREVVKG
jgi:hypothetical protein